MAKFTKYNNPNRRKRSKKSPYSQQYINERREELYQLLAKAETDEEKNILIDAFHASINP